MYAKVTTGYGSVEFSRKRLQARELSWCGYQTLLSVLKGKHTFRQCPQPRKCQTEGYNSSHNTLLHGADRVFPAKQSTNPNTIQSSGNTVQSTATSSQLQPNKTTTMSSVSDVKGILQVTELQLVNSSGLNTQALVLCDTACSNSWVARSLADRLGFHGKALNLTVKGINTEEVVDTRIVEVTVKPREHQDFEPFTINPFVKECLNVGSHIINVQALQEIYHHLAVLDPVTYSYKDIQMILGQDVHHAFRPLEYFSADEKRSPVAVRLPIGWVLSCPLPSSSCLTSTCFKVNIEQDNELASQLKSWYDIESFGANKQVDPQSAADARAHEIFENTTVHNGLSDDVELLWAADNTKLLNNYFSSLVQLKCLEKRLAKDEDLREKYISTIKEDLNKGYVIGVPDIHKVKNWSDKKWYPPHHPVLNPNKPGKVRRVLNGVAKFHGAPLNKSLFTGPGVNQAVIIEDTVSLATTVKKQTTPVPSLFPFDKFSSYQKHLRIAAYVLRFLPKHAGYRNPDGSIADPTELDEAERHLQYLVKGESFEAERKDLLDNKFVKRSSRIAPTSPFIITNGRIRSSGRIKRLIEVGFNVKYPIILDARHPFVKLFLVHTHVKHYHQGV